MAVSAAQALRKEKDVRADDCWIDEKWLDNNPDTSGSVMGFHT